MADDQASADDRQGPALSRRDLIRLGAVATVAASLGLDKSAASEPLRAVGARAAAQAAAPKFFTPAEFALVDELSELIIPTDAHSPGARAARVAAFIDGQLAEAWEEKDRTDWREGLRVVERLSQETSEKPFLQSSEDQRIAVLNRMAQNEAHPQKAEELFFKELKSRVVYAYYTSEIGIRREMEYKGNTYLNEFVGEDVTKI
jgi:Gluconate 2-dehydrogenase subunit 3